MTPDDLVTAKTIGEWTDLHERQVRKLASAGVIERDGRGRYRLQSTVRRINVHLREAAAGRGPSGDGGPDLATERALLARAQRAAQERANAIAEGRLFEQSEILAGIAPLLLAVRATMLAVPSRATPLLVGQAAPAINTVLTELVREALAGIASAESVADTAMGKPPVGRQARGSTASPSAASDNA